MTALSLFHRTCLQANAEHEPWVQTAIREAESAARWWREQSDDALWGLMFTPALHRAWMVWSEGYCPSCRQSVPMYNWKHDAFHHPWKMQCPHCGERFPQNDFGAYYRSGLDADGWFDAARADRSLLFNAGHPDPADPQHGFGVDGGDGWSAEGHRWRFIGAYLIYGQWKTLIVGGDHPAGGGPCFDWDRGVCPKGRAVADPGGRCLSAFRSSHPGVDVSRCALPRIRFHLA